MTVSTVPIIMARIKLASSSSPIAVFCDDEGSLDAVFGDTLHTLQRIKDQDPEYVGTYHQSMGLGTIRKKLLALSNDHTNITKHGYFLSKEVVA